MSKRTKWFLALLLALGCVVVVRAALVEILYLPLVRSGYPVVPTPTPTKTPNTPCLSLKTTGVCVTDIDFDPYSGGPLNEFIRLKNLSSTSVNMKDWRITSDSGNKYDLNFAFSLSGSGTVEIWTKSGDNDTDDLFMDRTEQFWNNHADCAYVTDDEREKVDSICYEETDNLGVIFFPPPATVP